MFDVNVNVNLKARMLTQTSAAMTSLTTDSLATPVAAEGRGQPPSRSGLHFPLQERLPELGTTLEVAPGVFWLRMGLPFALNHINLWLLRDRLPHPTQSGVMQEGWTAVDCGIDNAATREAWQQIETQALQGLPILRVLVTHMHPDHMGLAHWLCERWQAPLWMSTSEYQSALLACSGLSNFGGDPTVAFFHAHGWNRPEELAQVKARVGYYPSMVPKIPKSYVRLMADAQVRIGDRLWQCINGYGHSPEHMALHDAQGQLLISGDMLLPSISTNVSVYAMEPDGNPLQYFLDSLDKMQHLPDETLVLPSHGRPFQGAFARIAQLRSHHAERLDELVLACSAQALCAHDALPLIFKRALDVHQTTFAMGEAVAHLNLLWLEGRLSREQDAAGVYRFKARESQSSVKPTGD
ncbi:MBL fold metallo-hydrolase [Limnohabitans sp.]|uniref:MBL fold metallo-hydrolase n=1 Tax=Limnohabitans sp. TaxID=1907725 RepID=UPI0039BC68B6|nr:MBL fold metallo-hydrolase [Comamonadaceae bacterium]